MTLLDMSQSVTKSSSSKFIATLSFFFQRQRKKKKKKVVDVESNPTSLCHLLIQLHRQCQTSAPKIIVDNTVN